MAHTEPSTEPVPSTEDHLQSARENLALLLLLIRAVASAGDLGFEEETTEVAWSRAARLCEDAYDAVIAAEREA